MTTATQTFDDVDQRLLAEIQKQFPLDHRPFQVLGEKLGISEQECLERLGRLKAHQAVREISAVLDPAAMGYQLSLAAMKVAPARVEQAAEVINRHPGVLQHTHLNDPFNVWFAIAVPPQDSLERVLDILHRLTRSEETILLPTLRMYKGDVPDRAGAVWWEPAEGPELAQGRAKPVLTEEDLRFIRISQEDLPLLELPYAVVAEQAEATEEEWFAWARRAEQQGYLRRFAATLSSRPGSALAPSPAGAGQAHALVVWQIPPEQVDEVGGEMARFREVTHCYRRPVYRNWPYPLFTVIHAQSSSACMEAAKRIEERVGRFPHKHLFSTNDFPRPRIVFFDPALEAWWEDVGRPAQ